MVDLGACGPASRSDGRTSRSVEVTVRRRRRSVGTGGPMTRRPHNQARERAARIGTLGGAVRVIRPTRSDAEDEAWVLEGDGLGDLGDPARPLLDAEDSALRKEVEESAEVRRWDEWWPVPAPEQRSPDLLSSRSDR